MNNRNAILAVVIVLAILAGVSLTVLKTNSPAMGRILAQQSELLNSQKKLHETIMKLSSGGVPSMAGQAIVPGNNPQALEQRVALLENKVDALLKALQQGGPQGAAQKMPPQEDYTTVYKFDLSSAYIRGKKDAPVTVIEFVDMQCPFCSRFHSLSTDLLAAYPDKVKYVMKNFPLPFHPMARPAAKAAMAAGEQGKYYEMVDLILENSRDLSDAKFKDFAQNLGLDVAKFSADLEAKDAVYEQKIQADMQEAQMAQARGTPTFYLQGRKTSARDLAGFKKEIDEVLKGIK